MASIEEKTQSDTNDNFGVALYYPFMNVQDAEWLKSALLYWDNIRCMVPSSDFLTADMDYLRDEGVLIPTSTRSYSPNAAASFLRKMAPYCSNQGLLDQKVRAYLDATFPDLKDVAIHRDKAEADLFHKMGVKVAIGSINARGLSEFHHAQPYMAALYLVELAVEMSRQIHTPMLTDIPGLSGLANHILWTQESFASEVPAESMLMQLDLKFPAREQLEQLSFGDITRFRNARSDERRRFRKAIESIRNTAQTVHDTNALNDYLSDQRQEIRHAIEDHNRALGEVGLTSLISSLQVTWPAFALFGFGAVTGGNVGVALEIGGVALSLAQTKFAASSAHQKEITGCPWHYLISLDKNFR